MRYIIKCEIRSLGMSLGEKCSKVMVIILIKEIA